MAECKTILSSVAEASLYCESIDPSNNNIVVYFSVRPIYSQLSNNEIK